MAPGSDARVQAIEPVLPAENVAQRQKRSLAGGASIQEIYAAEVELTQSTYAVEEVKT